MLTNTEIYHRFANQQNESNNHRVFWHECNCNILWSERKVILPVLFSWRFTAPLVAIKPDDLKFWVNYMPQEANHTRRANAAIKILWAKGYKLVGRVYHRVNGITVENVLPVKF